LVGLEDLPVGNLSAGQQRRVALARFWLKKTATLWILDEPFTALDVDGIALLSKRLREHLAQQGTVIMTSHQVLDIDYPTKELVLEYRI
jgi:heme exporter protein A